MQAGERRDGLSPLGATMSLKQRSKDGLDPKRTMWLSTSAWRQPCAMLLTEVRLEISSCSKWIPCWWRGRCRLLASAVSPVGHRRCGLCGNDAFRTAEDWNKTDAPGKFATFTGSSIRLPTNLQTKGPMRGPRKQGLRYGIDSSLAWRRAA